MVPEDEGDNRVWLRRILPLQGKLSSIVATNLENCLKTHKIDYLSVSHRTKTEEGAVEKIQRKTYDDPVRQLTDLSGIRIVTYLEDDVTQIREVIRKLFDVDEANSLDRSRMLGADRVGYRSTHFVCRLGAQRDTLEEYRGLGFLSFEIQVRTVLQHAWAELAHDWTFKYGVELPAQIQRDLNLVAAALESADNNFNAIAQKINSYKEQVSLQTVTQIFEASIDSISTAKFIDEISGKLDIDIRGDIPKSGYEELQKFGIRTIGHLERLATAEFIDAHKQVYHSVSTPLGLVRRIMMFHDLEKYLRIKPSFNSITSQTYRLLRTRYTSQQIEQLFEKANIRVPKSI